MADQAGEKSQEPTQHRRDQAREKGQVAYSQDLGSAAMLIISILLIRSWGGNVIEMAGRFMRHQLSTVGPLAIDRTDAIELSHSLVNTIGKSVFPILGLLALAGVCTSVFQTGFLFVPSRLMPDFGRLSPLAGVKRIVSLTGFMKLSFGMFKVAIVAMVAATVLYLRHKEVLVASELSASELAPFMIDLALSAALWVGVALLVLALFDFAYQKWKQEQDLRMTQQEVRDELKNMQGDPQMVARRRAIQRQMAMNRVGDKVPQADVVVTNPTELAIAIQYQPEEMAAPIVLAKGAGVLAQRIRRLALENNIPVVERKPLAQSLYKNVEIGHPIPDADYAAVAEVLAYVYKLKGKTVPNPLRAA